MRSGNASTSVSTIRADRASPALAPTVPYPAESEPLVIVTASTTMTTPNPV